MDVLVVEDKPLIREAVARDLQQAGFQIEEAATAEAALAAIEKAAAAGSGPPFVVVTGLHLGPGMNGLALAAEVQRRWPEVGVVYMTCHPDALDGHLLGPREHYVVKPFAAETLRNAVRRLTPALALGRIPPLAGLGQVVAAALGLSGPKGP
ncbi:response regulator [Belnapia sp. T6]|uniref:Response regulator n=1 Tax=Belnapia mucosa TaxID=2804532 RepID=A0ABS1UYR5_9PROT|nr:response regulator [Belnapia mucosa]MBL6454590.1 response regulator [Belnapia mucosa]